MIFCVCFFYVLCGGGERERDMLYSSMHVGKQLWNTDPHVTENMELERKASEPCPGDNINIELLIRRHKKLIEKKRQLT